MVAKRDRLRALQMGEAGHDAIGMVGGADNQRVLKRAKACIDFINRAAHPEAEIGRHLVVAAARGVESAGDRADLLGEPRFGLHMNVFECEIIDHAVRGIIIRHRVQPSRDGGGVVGGDDADHAQHRDMRFGGSNIFAPQTLVERDRRVNLAHHRRRSFGKAAAPHGIGAWIVPFADRASPDRDAGCRLR